MRKMVFVGGPRQVGKTTLAKSLKRSKAYYNWDIKKDRKIILEQEFSAKKTLILDEIHKYPKWRNYLKGLFDQVFPERQLLVTGSAKLNLLRRGGDSLQGRYHYLRLHPLTFAELKMETTKDLKNLFELGGFPEPFIGSSKKEANRWSKQYGERLLYDEINTIKNIQDLTSMELLFHRLPELVGSPLSLNALREDLQVAHATIKSWVETFELFYGIFRLSPFGAPRIRAVKKEQKHYHYDWNLIEDQGCRFENMIAVHLLKWVHFLEDTEGRFIELQYFRDIDRREVDFVITERKKPLYFIECKMNDAPISPGLNYLKKRFPEVKAFQLSLRGKKDYQSPLGVRVCPAVNFLANLI